MKSKPYYFRIRIREDGSTDFDYESFLEFVRDERVLVVGVSGKSHAVDSKASFVDKYLGRDAFVPRNTSSSEESFAIEGVHDSSKGVIFLHLRSFHDGSSLLSEGIAQMKAKGVQGYLSQGRETAVLLNLFLFHVCHIVIIHFPTPVFDTSYINLFKTLEALRLEFMSDILRVRDTSGLQQEKPASGSFFTPRLLFYFASPPQSLRDSTITDLQKYHNAQLFEFGLCSEIISLTRAVIPSVSLFKIPTRKEFCFVEGNEDKILNNDIYSLDRMNFFKTQKGFDYEEDYGDPFVPYYEEISLEDSRQRKNFSRFLHNHISWMWSRSKGNTNVNWEFPTSEQWYGVASGMFELFCSPGKNEAIRRSSRMEAYVNVIRNVSKSICSMALPRALDKYEEGLRSHYLEEIHNLKLLQAMSVLSIHARGPCAVETAKSLQEECNFLWVSSRQQCEALSLSGKHCAKKVHCEDEPHSSHFVYHSTCNCGKTQGPRGDPFSLKEANIDFYSHLEESCCQDLQHWELPFKNPPSTSALLGSTEESEEDLLTISADVLDDDISSLSLSIGPNVLTEEESERNLLPELPHWSLILMGPSSKYSHSSGLNQPGFLGNYKHLLSWDIPITKTELPVLRERWPNLVETALKKMTLNSRGCGADLGVLAKVFFGCEYECSRGHRFIASSPSFKASKSSRGVSTRGWGAQVAGSDMPLYIPCSCSSRRSTSLGQLLRIHVVSPKAPLNVKLNPRIQPTEGGPIFLPGLSEPFKLPPNTYWILRLPFLYASKDAGVHLPPLFMENEAGKLFKGFITVTEDFEID